MTEGFPSSLQHAWDLVMDFDRDVSHLERKVLYYGLTWMAAFYGWLSIIEDLSLAANISIAAVLLALAGKLWLTQRAAVRKRAAWYELDRQMWEFTRRYMLLMLARKY